LVRCGLSRVAPGSGFAARCDTRSPLKTGAVPVSTRAFGTVRTLDDGVYNVKCEVRRRRGAEFHGEYHPLDGWPEPTRCAQAQVRCKAAPPGLIPGRISSTGWSTRAEAAHMPNAVPINTNVGIDVGVMDGPSTRSSAWHGGEEASDWYSVWISGWGRPVHRGAT
jgi:hypothetical protein